MTDFSQLYYYKATQDSFHPNSVFTGKPGTIQADLCIYGATPAGIAAALQAKRLGLSAVIAEFSRNLGGMTASGLGRTDVGNKSAIGGIAREFYRELGLVYGGEEPDGVAWAFEPHVAEGIFTRWLEEAEVPVYFNQALSSVAMANGRITELTMEDGTVYKGAMFVDATYEGDLLARAGVSYTVGREANAQYKETLNGVHFGHPKHNFTAWVDPYVIEGKPDSGLLLGVMDVEPGFQGQGDRSVQAYNFRICLSNVAANRIPFPEPPDYDPNPFELLLRYIRAGVWDALRLNKLMPKGKSDLNNWGGISTDHIGANHAWPEADYAARELMFQDHVRYNLGLLYFLSTDERVPLSIRAEVRQWGLPADEFQRTNGWPHQLYVREGRRLVSDLVMTEHHCRHHQVVEDSVGLAAYTMDSHNCRRIVLEGRCVNEGNVEVNPTGPYPISYRAIVPKAGQCENLLVPVCLSSTHIAYGSIRMEPVFMILGQSAATAAALALEKACPVQDVDYGALRSRLLLDGQILRA